MVLLYDKSIYICRHQSPVTEYRRKKNNFDVKFYDSVYLLISDLDFDTDENSLNHVRIRF